jgi:hypothetical protein
MTSEYRNKLLATLARIDQELAEAETLLIESSDAENLLLAAKLREMLRRMRGRGAET